MSKERHTTDAGPEQIPPGRLRRAMQASLKQADDYYWAQGKSVRILFWYSMAVTIAFLLTLVVLMAEHHRPSTSVKGSEPAVPTTDTVVVNDAKYGGMGRAELIYEIDNHLRIRMSDQKKYLWEDFKHAVISGDDLLARRIFDDLEKFHYTSEPTADEIEPLVRLYILLGGKPTNPAWKNLQR